MPVTVTAVAIVVVVVIIVFIAAYFLIVNNKQHEQQKQFNVIIIIITVTVVAAPLLLLLPALSNLTLFTLLEHFLCSVFFIFGSLHTLLQFKHLIACLMPSLFVYKLV